MPQSLFHARLAGGKNASVFILWTGSIAYEGFAFRQVACLCLFSCYAASHIGCCWGGVSGRWLGGGSRSPFLVVFSGGSP